MEIKKHIKPSDFRDFLRENRKGKAQEYFLSKTTNKISEKVIDDESCICTKEIVFENEIVDFPIVILRKNQKITIKNCIFICSLFIGDAEGVLESVSIEDSLFLRCFRLSGAHNNMIVELRNSNFSEAEFTENTFPELSLVNSNFYSLQIQYNEIKSFFTDNNRIKVFRCAKNSFGIVDFNHRQVDLKWIAKNGRAIIKNFSGEHEKSRKDNLKIIYSDIGDLLFDFIGYNYQTAINSINYKYQTFDFIREKTRISTDQKSLVELRHYKNIISTSGIGKILGAATKSFQSPLRILLAILFFIFLFSILYYYLPWMEFQCEGGATRLGYLDSLYYSGITFTTIGYGDISPVGISKFFSIIEGILGIFLSSSFIVCLVRRYVEK